MQRLSDEQIDAFAKAGMAMAIEIKERRAADLSDPQIEAVKYAREIIAADPFIGSLDDVVQEHRVKCHRALQAFDAILRAHSITAPKEIKQ